MADSRHGSGKGGGGGSQQSAKERALQLAAEVMRKRHGDEAAEEFVAQFERADAAKAKTMERRAQAEAISAVRVRLGEGGEHDADLAPPPPARPSEDRQSRRSARPLSQVLEGRKERKAQRTQVREERPEALSLRSAFRRRHARHNAREVEQAEQIAKKALEQHGIKHHFRLLPKVAFFAAYVAGLDRNGVGALQALMSVNMPRKRIDQVLKAAYEPRGYTPRRDVTTGKRSHQKRYEHDGRKLGGVLWEAGHRNDEHPGAIRVIQVAIFLWVAKVRTKRDGHSYVVRGFGRGVFASICRCGKDALFGHDKGVPGALRALQQSGFVNYGQPPAQKVKDIDRGPSGHAYNVFWFRTDPGERALEALHKRIAELPTLSALQRVVTTPELLEQQRAARELVDAPLDGALRSPRAQAPPGTFTDDEIPF